MGVVSDEKLLDLLELAMSSNATETVIRARELMDSGVDPIVLISQLVTLIVDIIAGTYPSVDAKHNNSFFGGRTCKFISVIFFFMLHLFFYTPKDLLTPVSFGSSVLAFVYACTCKTERSFFFNLLLCL